MTTTIIRRGLAAMALGVVLVGVTGCGGKKKQEEIDQLTEEIVGIEDQLEAERERAEQAEEEAEKLRDEMDEMKGEKRDLEGRLKTAERAVERFEKREAMAKEREERENAREPSRVEKLAAAKELAGKQLGAMVEVKGDVTSGSGFLVQSDEKTWVYMAADVLSGNTKLEVALEDGGKLTPSGTFQVANDAGVARLEVTDEVETKLAAGEPGEVKSGLALLGVSDAGVLVEGRSYGLENGVVRLDSRFSNTLPGSPVFHGETGALMGMVLEGTTDKRTLWVRDNRNERAPMRSATRLDREIEWTTVPIATFLDEAKALADADRLTRLVEAFAEARPSETGVDMTGTLDNGTSVEDFLNENSMVGPVASLKELNEWLEEKGERASESDINRRTEGAYTEMGRLSGRLTATLAARKFSPYHAKMAEESLEWRRAAEKKLADLIKGLDG